MSENSSLHLLWIRQTVGDQRLGYFLSAFFALFSDLLISEAYMGETRSIFLSSTFGMVLSIGGFLTLSYFFLIVLFSYLPFMVHLERLERIDHRRNWWKPISNDRKREALLKDRTLKSWSDYWDLKSEEMYTANPRLVISRLSIDVTFILVFFFLIRDMPLPESISLETVGGRFVFYAACVLITTGASIALQVAIFVYSRQHRKDLRNVIGYLKKKIEGEGKTDERIDAGL